MTERIATPTTALPSIPVGSELVPSMPADAVRFDGLVRHVENGAITARTDDGREARVLVIDHNVVAAHAVEKGDLTTDKTALDQLQALFTVPGARVAVTAVDHDSLSVVAYTWFEEPTFGPVPVAWFSGGPDTILTDIADRDVTAAVILTSPGRQPTVAVYRGANRLVPVDSKSDPLRDQLAALAKGEAEPRRAARITVWEPPAGWTPGPLDENSRSRSVATAAAPSAPKPPAKAGAPAAAPVAPRPATAPAPAAEVPSTLPGSPATPVPTANGAEAAADTAIGAEPATPAADGSATEPSAAETDQLPLSLIADTVEADLEKRLRESGSMRFAPRVRAVADEGWTVGDFCNAFEHTTDIPGLDAETRLVMLTSWRELAKAQLMTRAAS